ncbi:unnamed protein product [Closterium sp. NIES-54]
MLVPLRWSRAAGAGGTAGAGGSASPGGAGATCPRGARTGVTGAAGRGGATGAGATGAAGDGGATGVVTIGGSGAGAAESSDGPAGAGAAVGAGGTAAGGAAGAGAPVGAGVDATGAAGATARASELELVRTLLVVSLLSVQCLSRPSQSYRWPPLFLLRLPTLVLLERREHELRPASPVRTARTSRRVPRQRPPAVPSTHQMALRPSTASQRVPLPSPPVSSLLALADPESDSLRVASPTVRCFLATAVTDPSFYLVPESASVCPPSVRDECAISKDVLEDRQEEFQCFAAALHHLVSTLLAQEGDPDAPDIPTPRSYAEAIEGPYSSQWQAAMDAEMAS